MKFPLSWLLEHAAPSIQYRAITEVARLPVPEAVKTLPMAQRAALLIAVQQQPDGTWSSSMLGVPSARAENFEGIGTVSAVRRLLEYGWDREAPPILHARRILFRLLAEDEDPAYLFELGGKGKGEDPDLTHRGRTILREAAGGVLAQAGYEGDPRLRGAVRRILDRISTFFRSPMAQKPFMRVGNQHVLAPEATPPSLFVLQMLAYMPLFRNEYHEIVDRIYHYITQPLPRQEPVQLFGKKVMPQPHLVLGDMLPHRNAVDADVPFALLWLELMARLGFLRRNENWCKLFERFLDDCDASGVWHPHKGTATPKSANPLVWPSYPLETSQAGEERWADVTFRLGLIARLMGRPIELT